MYILVISPSHPHHFRFGYGIGAGYTRSHHTYERSKYEGNISTIRTNGGEQREKAIGNQKKMTKKKLNHQHGPHATGSRPVHNSVGIIDCLLVWPEWNGGVKWNKLTTNLGALLFLSIPGIWAVKKRVHCGCVPCLYAVRLHFTFRFERNQFIIKSGGTEVISAVIVIDIAVFAFSK